MSRLHDGEDRRDWWRNLSGPKKTLVAIGGAVVVAGLAALFGFVFMWLWNALMPRVFRLPTIGYWEGWGLVVLSSILFKGSSHRHSFSAEGRRKRFLRDRMRSESSTSNEGNIAEELKS